MYKPCTFSDTPQKANAKNILLFVQAAIFSQEIVNVQINGKWWLLISENVYSLPLAYGLYARENYEKMDRIPLKIFYDYECCSCNSSPLFFNFDFKFFDVILFLKMSHWCSEFNQKQCSWLGFMNGQCGVWRTEENLNPPYRLKCLVTATGTLFLPSIFWTKYWIQWQIFWLQRFFKKSDLSLKISIDFVESSLGYIISQPFERVSSVMIC